MLNDKEIILVSTSYDDKLNYIEYTKGEYVIENNKLIYTRKYTTNDNGNTWSTCVYSDNYCHTTSMYFPLTEEFIIDFTKNTITSSTYISDYFKIESTNLELKYIDDDAKESIQLFRSKFEEKISDYLKNLVDQDNIQFNSWEDTSGNNSGEEYFIISIFGENDDENYDIGFTFTSDGILKYTINSDYLDENGNIRDFRKVFLDEFILGIALETLTDVKGYNVKNLSNWANSLTDEQINNLTIENDGISLKFKKIPTNNEGISGEYINELNIDVVNGIKAYDPNVTYTPIEEDNIFSEIEKNKDKIESSTKQPENLSSKKDSNLPDNPKTGSFVSIVLLIIATMVSGVFYFISKKKNKLYKI